MRGLRALIAIALVGTAIQGKAAIIDQSTGGTAETAFYYKTGTVGEQISNTGGLTAEGALPLFNIDGAVLISYRIFGDFEINTGGSFSESFVGGSVSSTIPAGSVSILGFNLGIETDDIGFCGGTFCDPAFATSAFSLNLSGASLSSVIGSGTLDVIGQGSTALFGKCDASEDCTEVDYIHSATALLRNLRVEWTYCTTPGEDGCPDAVAGVNTPGAIAVSEPATIALLGLALGGLAFVRRRTSARRTA